MSIASWLADPQKKVALAVHFGWGLYDGATDSYQFNARYTTWQDGFELASKFYSFLPMDPRFTRESGSASSAASMAITLPATADPGRLLLDPSPLSTIVVKVRSINPDAPAENLVEIYGYVTDVAENPSGIRAQIRIIVNDFKYSLKLIRVGGSALNFCINPRFGDRNAKVWSINSAYQLGALVKPPGLNVRYRLRCTTAGISNSVTPVWPTDVQSSYGTTLTDNTVVWTVEASLGCKYNLDLVSYSGTVTSASDNSLYIELNVSGTPPIADQAWRFGTIKVAGAVLQISGYVGVNVWKLSRPAKADWIGKSCTIIEGCDRTLLRCKELNNNNNFNGWGLEVPIYNPAYESTQ